MKKIMFNDKYKLTNAVLNGRKTMTRRLCKEFKSNKIIYADEVESVRWYWIENIAEFLLKDGSIKVSTPRYKVNDVVAVAQSYETMANSGYIDIMLESPNTYKKEYCGGGWSNKEFVRADLMPHTIRVTDVKIEQLQDISIEDCIKEGVDKYTPYPRLNFQVLIDAVSGKDTWLKNPWVFAYEFELIK